MPGAWWATFRWLFFGALAAVLVVVVGKRGDGPDGAEYQQGLDQGRQETKAKVKREKQRNQSRADRVGGWLTRMAGDGRRPVD